MNNLNYSIFMSVILLQNSCFEGPGFFQKDGSTISKYSVVSKAEGGVTEGEFSASNTATQVLGVNNGSEISGASLSIQPGALAIDTRISLQEGASIASSGLASEIGISGAVNPSGPAVVLSSSIAIDASQPMKVKLPKKSSGLALGENDNLIVVYRAYQAGLDRTVVGVIPTNELKISNDVVEVSTRYFGSYQVATAEVAIKKPIVKETTAPILTKNEEKKLAKVSLNIAVQPILKDEREVEVGLKLSTPIDLLRCSAFVFENSDTVWIATESTSSAAELEVLSSGEIDPYTYSPESASAQTVYFRFACVDVKGRDIASKSTLKITIPEKSSGGAPAAFEIVGWAAFSESPLQRVFGTETTKVLQGSCESGTDVKIYIDSGAKPGPVSVPCTSDQFALTLNSTTGCTASSSNTCLAPITRGYRVWAMQDFDRADETYIYVSDLTPTLLTNANFYSQLSTEAVNTMYIIAENISLTPPWTSINSLNAIVEGEGRSISGLSVIDGSMFTGISTTGRIAHVVFENPVLRTTALSSITQIGVVAGTITSSVIDDITINHPDILTSASSVSYLGVLAGKVLTNAKIRSIAVRGDPTNRSSYGIISVPGMYVGGVIGGVDDSNLEDILVDSITIKALSKIGGIMGTNFHIPKTPPDLVLRGARVDVDLESTQSSTFSAYVGGIVGVDEIDTTLESVQVRVNFLGTIPSMFFGGIAGFFDGKVKNAEVTAIATNTFIGDNLGGVSGYQGTGSAYNVLIRPQFYVPTGAMGAFSGSFFSSTSVPELKDIVLASDASMFVSGTNTWSMKLHPSTTQNLSITGNRIAYPSTMAGSTAINCNLTEGASVQICASYPYDNANFNAIFANFDFITEPKWFSDGTRYEPYLFDIPELSQP